jgi:hypothetical protein
MSPHGCGWWWRRRDMRMVLGLLPTHGSRNRTIVVVIIARRHGISERRWCTTLVMRMAMIHMSAHRHGLPAGWSMRVMVRVVTSNSRRNWTSTTTRRNSKWPLSCTRRSSNIGRSGTCGSRRRRTIVIHLHMHRR